MMVVLLALAAYLLGSFPTSHLAGRLHGIDLRQRGSGNLGATNVYRVLGARAAVPVVAVDVAKGYVPTALFPLWDGSAAADLALLYGLLAIAGHVWSVFARFSGGKGVATGAGVLVALAPLTSVVALLVWIGFVLLTRVVSVASIVAASLVPLIAYVMDAPRPTILFCAGVAGFVWWTHRDNLRRLLRGEEHRFEKRRAGPEESLAREEQ